MASAARRALSCLIVLRTSPAPMKNSEASRSVESRDSRKRTSYSVIGIGTREMIRNTGSAGKRRVGDRIAARSSTSSGSTFRYVPEPCASPPAGARLEPGPRPLRPAGERTIDVGPCLERRRSRAAAVDALGEQRVGLGVADLALDHGGFEEPPGLGVERAVAGGMRAT